MCSDSYPIPILTLFFLYHPYIPYFLILHFLVSFLFLLHACMYSHQVSNSNGSLAPKIGLLLRQSWMVIPIYEQALSQILFCPPIIMYCEVCYCLHIHSVVNVLVMGRVLGQSLMFISTMGILLAISKGMSPL